MGYDRLLELIATTGYKPTAEELAAAGMSEAQAKAWLGYWQGQQAGSGGSSSSRQTPTGDPKPIDNDSGENDSGEPKRDEPSFTQMLANAQSAGASPQEIAELIDAMVADGTISPGQAIGLKHIWAR